MNIRIDTAINGKVPDLTLGTIIYEQVALTESPHMLQGRINLFVESLRAEHDIAQATEIPGVAGWRNTFKKLGIDPSRYRPSSESLIRRLLKENPFFWINSAVDINNFLSVYHALPYGIYDTNKLSGEIVCRLGGEDEHYEGLNGRDVQMQGKLLLADSLGAFGSPIVDSVRSRVTLSARSLLQVIFFYEGMDQSEREKILHSSAKMFTEINGGEAVSVQLVQS